MVGERIAETDAAAPLGQGSLERRAVWDEKPNFALKRGGHPSLATPRTPPRPMRAISQTAILAA
jgi:hypothetical protein